MATDFADQANLRILWTPLGTLPSFRDGLQPAGAPIVIDAFVKGPSGGGTNEPGIRAGSRSMSGFITRYATPADPDDWLTAGSGWSWTDTGLRPPGLVAGHDGLPAFLGDLFSLPTIVDGSEQGKVEITGIGGQFGVGGIGAELRASLGDAIDVVFSTVS